ncbi:riboflavin synthase subunit alpha [Candidatus Endolissoclinum faulkneri L5]|uniref:Riboflavin synthase subunit alpha n=1 Tax=Candidatus Endolissoclinum faulkneri L5 TaxID=1401328 RepID=V9TS40_9PROT|nr:MFS transporter [Candidatus Endolissoclinum faulkneri]AHC73704.1 riboflavin synthase subunit alpha [Candidatus Endolissoclinum faulkneri L5]
MLFANPLIKNIALLTICQALSMSSITITIAVTGLCGRNIASDPMYATLPLTLQSAAATLTTMPAALYMRYVGRRFGFITGVFIGMTGAFIGISAIFSVNFLLFCIASTLIGSFHGFTVLYRYAAADTTTSNFRSQAISLVLAGGVLAAIIGPEIAKASYDWFAPIMFAGNFLAIAALQAITLLFLTFLRIPRPNVIIKSQSCRPLMKIVRQPVFFVAVISAMVGYSSMTFIMTSAPLVMEKCGFSFRQSTSVIQWHSIGMFLPSFFTGSLINRLGVIRIMLTGVITYLICIAINFSEVKLLQLFSSMILLGIAWNFLFIGGTTLLTESYKINEREKIQGFADFLIFSASTFATFSSGYISHTFGWQAVNICILPFIVFAGIVVIWYSSFSNS